MKRLFLSVAFLMACGDTDVPTGDFGPVEVFPDSMASVTDCTTKQDPYVCAICKDSNGQPVVGKLVSGVDGQRLCVERCDTCQ